MVPVTSNCVKYECVIRNITLIMYCETETMTLVEISACTATGSDYKMDNITCVMTNILNKMFFFNFSYL